MKNTYSKENSSFIDIIKGYRRLTNVPLDATSIFKSFASASAYALTGLSGGSAYIGQLIVVISDITNNNLNTVYTVSSDYTLQKVIASSENDQYYYYFSVDTTKSDTALITFPKDFVITKLTVYISTAFTDKSGNSMPYGISSINVVSKGVKTVLADYNDFVTDSADSKYIIEQQYSIVSTIANITITFADLSNTATGAGCIVIN